MVTLFRHMKQFRHVYKKLSGRGGFIEDDTKHGFEYHGVCFLPFKTILVRVGHD